MRTVSFVLALAAAIAAGNMSSENAAAQKQRELQSPGAFSSIADRATRSKALFLEAAKVITDPRCMNCHPAGDHPLQGDDHHIHQPAAFRGEANNGGPGLKCATCHSSRNFTLSVGEASYQSIPGHPRWALAPLEMAWVISAARLRTRRVMEVGASRCCTSTSQRTIWWHGLGAPVRGGCRHPEPRSSLEL